MKANNPIGVFDSGIGGLTVVKELIKQLPKEDIIYFGDKAYFPYGDKSKAVITERAKKITDFLLEQHCKLILIACNSASAAAFDVVKEKTATEALAANVIDPAIKFLQENFNGKRIGLLATRQTVNSNVYQNKIKQLNSRITLSALATPVLTLAIEEGFINSEVINVLLKEYLACEELQNIQALMLACTHYPLVQKQISAYYNNAIPIIDPAVVVVSQALKDLSDHDLLNKSGGRRCFYISDDPAAVNSNIRLFFPEIIAFEYLRI
jgi:glutamate racemase